MDSPRCSKALREKMQETPDFATDFAKMSLLANVGRVNTTMTCPFSCSCFFYMIFNSTSPSPSRNAYGITYLPSRPFAPESRCESSRRTQDKEHPQSLQSQRRGDDEHARHSRGASRQSGEHNTIIHISPPPLSHSATNRQASGVVPSTSIVNLLFVLSNHFTVRRSHLFALSL